MAEFDKYRGPNVAVDVAVFTLTDNGALAVLVQDRTKSPRGKVLPGRFLRDGETVGDGLRAALRDKASLAVGPIQAALDHAVAESNSIEAHLVGVFDKPGRDRRSTWSMSLAHYLVVPTHQVVGATGTFVPVRQDGSVEFELLFDHDAIVGTAATDLRVRYESIPDPENLLAANEIALPDLQEVHEAVLGERLRVDTFRRRMLEMLDQITDPNDPKGQRTKTRPSGPSGGPPTRLFTRRTSDDVMMGESSRLRLPRAVD